MVSVVSVGKASIIHLHEMQNIFLILICLKCNAEGRAYLYQYHCLALVS